MLDKDVVNALRNIDRTLREMLQELIYLNGD